METPTSDSATSDPADPRIADAVQAARLYYFQDQTMAAIGRDMGVSRSTVSRLITYARTSGLVEIKISTPHGQAPRIEREFSERYGVRAHVVTVPELVGDLERLEKVATFAGRLLASFFDSDMVMGIAWGTTLSEVSKHLAPKRTYNSYVVQLNGAANTRTTGISYASDIIRTIADATVLCHKDFRCLPSSTTRKLGSNCGANEASNASWTCRSEWTWQSSASAYRAATYRSRLHRRIPRTR